jgi:hypothetical protein
VLEDGWIWQTCSPNAAQLVVELLRHPLLLVALLLLFEILLGAGRPLGLRLLFWHEDAKPQWKAGAASTLLVAVILFVAYLLSPARVSSVCHDAPRRLGCILGAGGVVWAAFAVLAAAFHRFLQFAPAIYAAAGTGSGRPEPESAHAASAPGLKVPQTRRWPFVGGVLVTAIAIALAHVALSPFEERVNELAAPFAARVGVAEAAPHLLAALVFSSIAIAYLRRPSGVTPAMGICMALAIVAALYGFLEFYVGSPGLAMLLLAALLWRGGREPYKIRAAESVLPYGAPRTYPPVDVCRDEVAPPAALVARGRRPLVIVCASGGGIRAGTWTAALLGQLDEVPGFTESTRLVTGASGGMVGAAFWVAELYRRAGGVPDGRHPTTRAFVAHSPKTASEKAASKLPDVAAAVARDCLTPLACQLVFNDLKYLFRARCNPEDRGRALEKAWIDHSGGTLSVTFSDLAAGERAGRWPSLVFSPMIVEDGRRLLLSNLDLSQVVENRVRWTNAANGAPSVASISAYALGEIFRNSLGDVSLATAARLSASFPYVSPAVVLPTVPRRRVVDAGYYDNYGLSLACGWLGEADALGWIERHVSRVLVIQIRDSVSQLSIDPASPREREDARAPTPRESDLARGLEGLTTPVAGLLSARNSVMLFRNDGELEAVTALLDRHRPGFVRTEVFDFRGEASLSWYLTRDEIDGMAYQLAEVQPKIDRVAEWLARPDEPTRSATA